MEYKIEEKEAPGRGKVKVLGATFEEGKPEDVKMGKWREKMTNREEMLKYIETGERYWYSKDWCGSEKRKKPA